MSTQRVQKRLLIVDDDRIARVVHRLPLVNAGYLVEEAESGEEAIKKFLSCPNQFDVVLMDYNMPNMNGAATTQELRRIESSEKHTAIIGITGHINQDVKSICLSAGMDAVMSKPVLFEDLEKIINKLIN